MKNPFLLITMTLFCLIMSSACDNEDETLKPDNPSDIYTSNISQDRINLAESLVEAFKSNKGMSLLAVNECYKMFDGDRNVLLKDICQKPINQLKSTNNLFGELLNNCMSNNTTTLKSGSSINNVNRLLTNDPSLQLYFFRGETAKDSVSFNGIVVLPENYNEKIHHDLILIKNDGTQSSIKGNVDPKENYLVISRNERLGMSWNGGWAGLDPRDIHNPVNKGKSITIKRAKFISIKAKRAVESWAAGDPEVRLNVIYALKNTLTNTWETKPSTFMYPKNWVKTSWLLDGYTTWNNTVMNLPYWNYDTQGLERRIIFTEEDGDSAEKETTFVYTDPLTKTKTTSTVKVPASDGDQVIADSYINKNTPAGIKYWGLIKFELVYPITY